ncbi:2-oxoglutarate dehydrogenase, E2 component, dihydrolipoamide succinyltransferase [Hoyosella rhizosphaerae]|uniref:Dihydrolipoamide acetyltransferase component of pyruvate dehydrogenase complex n=1 Tax=Hoyosella rhizosphaerae TaxID=1755582 RepID=A0A916XH00_9ACTN|nr:2-oxoglutarate dehydrogenase, E2 component, dihydrolipoamide succinyltransferase [Hoyosella rhizosphaerae]MBN4927973.1 2-oxoglutarate dehydrogenase, E2 component, dihydrolipoamide succinyltransferase [Hoyosella rhizosphaerae]GGC71367.1 dihydrolipoamide acetyltransferase component of pyruvate dehydrogenase complex [Hoyosella rhizosphaerae]
MAFSVQMPALGESVTEGTVTRWLKQEGDTVEVDEPLLEVSTDKVDTEIPSPAAGVLTKIVAQEDDVVDIGGELAIIGDGDDDSGSSDSGSSDADSSEQAEPEAEEAPAEEEAPEETEQSAPAEESADDEEESSGGEGSPVTMPALGESVTEGTVTRWLKAVGDTVEVDEPLLEVSTDKVDTEIPSPVAGTLLEISAEEDEVVEIGGQLAIIGSGKPASAKKAKPEPKPEPEPEPEPKAESKPEPKAEPKAESKPAPKQETDTKPAKSESKPSSGSTPYVTPLVRKLASEHKVDLADVRGSGVGGRIRKEDVLAAAAKAKESASSSASKSAGSKPSTPVGVRPELAKLRGTTQKANRIRQITAIKTRESLQTTAQLTQTHEVDLTRVAALRNEYKAAFKERHGVNLTFLPFFAKAVVEALQLHPNINASYDEEAKEITYYGAEHLGIAVDTENGLLSPVIHNAGDMSVADLAKAIADIAQRARSGGLKPDELSGGTFTVTNIGSNGALFDTPILVPPQAAMLGTGAVVKRAVVTTDADGNNSIAIRSMAYLPLTYDHRLVDGADAGRFVSTLKQRLEDGEFADDLEL